MNSGQRQFHSDPDNYQHPYYKTSKQLINSIQNLKLQHKYTFHQNNSPKLLIDQKQKQFQRGILLQSAQLKRNIITEKKRGLICESPLSIHSPQTTRIKTQNSNFINYYPIIPQLNIIDIDQKNQDFNGQTQNTYTSRHFYAKNNNNNELCLKSQNLNLDNIAKNEKEIDKLIQFTFKQVPDRMSEIKPLNNHINNFINKLQLQGKEKTQCITTKSIQQQEQQEMNGDSQNIMPTDIFKNTSNITPQYIKFSPRQLLHYSTIKMNFKTETTTKTNKKNHKIMNYINQLQLRILRLNTEQNKLLTQQRKSTDRFERYKNTEL